MKKILLPVFILLFFIVSCNQSGQKMEESIDMAAVRPTAPMEQPEKPAGEINPVDLSVNTSATQKKIIRDGNITLKVKDIAAVRKQVDTLVSALGGYIGNESYNSYDQESRYFLIIRIPTLHFDELIARLEKGTGEIMNKDINARDVTEEFIDLSARLTSKRNYINRYTEFLKKAGTIKEILEIEEYIRKIEEEIESAEGRLRYLNNQVNYSTLNLTLTQEKDYTYKPHPSRNFIERLKESLHKGWKGFVGFILLMIRLWPFWVLATTAWIFYRRIKKKKKITTGFKKI